MFGCSWIWVRESFRYQLSTLSIHRFTLKTNMCLVRTGLESWTQSGQNPGSTMGSGVTRLEARWTEHNKSREVLPALVS